MKKKLFKGIFSIMLALCMICILAFPVDAASTEGASDEKPPVSDSSSKKKLDYVNDVSLYVYDGTPYVAYKDSSVTNKLTVKKYTNNSWINVGTAGFSSGKVGYISLLVDNGTPYVAYRDSAKGQKLVVQKYNGSSWVNVGTAGFSDGKVAYVSLSVDNGIPYVGFMDLDHKSKATVMKYNGNEWVSIGKTGFSSGTAEYTSLSVQNGVPYLAFRDLTNYSKATVMTYDNNGWSTIGTEGFSKGRADYISLQVYNGTPYVAYKDFGNSFKATVMTYNGSSWVPVGIPGFSQGFAEHCSLFIYNGTPYVAFKDAVNSFRTTVMKYDGTSWVSVGQPGFSQGATEHISLYVDNGIPYTAYALMGNGNKPALMKYTGSAWSALGNVGLFTMEVPKVDETPITPTPDPKPIDEPIAGFTDISDHWALEAIKDMSSKNIINGTGDNKFEPDRKIMRAEFSAIIVRALDLEKKTDVNPFYDVKADDWYSDYVKTALGYSLIGGYDGAFHPNLNITREEGMAIIERTMAVIELNPNLSEDEIANVLSDFNDQNEIANWAEKSIASCIKTGIVSGREGQIIAPKDSITRAEVAVIIQRLLEKSK